MMSGNGWHDIFIQDPITKKTEKLGIIGELTAKCLEPKYCVVTDSGLCYTTYDQWIKNHFPRYVIDFLYNHSIGDIKSDRLYEIIGHAPHSYCKEIELYLIQDMDTAQVFIIEEEGIKKCEDVLVSTKDTITLQCDKLDTTIFKSIEREERNMNNKIVDLYYERKIEEIRNKYDNLVEEEYEKFDVVKEYKELVNTFTTSLAEMANRYNTEERKMLLKTGYMGEYTYELNPNLRDDLRESFRVGYNNEVRELDLLIEEVRAQLSLSDDRDYQIDILTRYDIINKKGKLNI